MGKNPLELFLSRFDDAAVDQRVAKDGAAAETLAAEGFPIRLVRSIGLPDKKTCFLLIDAIKGKVVVKARTALSNSASVGSSTDDPSPATNHAAVTTTVQGGSPK